MYYYPEILNKLTEIHELALNQQQINHISYHLFNHIIIDFVLCELLE